MNKCVRGPRGPVRTQVPVPVQKGFPDGARATFVGPDPLSRSHSRSGFGHFRPKTGQDRP